MREQGWQRSQLTQCSCITQHGHTRRARYDDAAHAAAVTALLSCPQPPRRHHLPACHTDHRHRSSPQAQRAAACSHRRNNRIAITHARSQLFQLPPCERQLHDALGADMNMATFERRLCSMWPSIAIALQTSGLLCIASVCALLYDDRSLLLSVERLFALGAATPTAAYCAVVAPPPQSRRRQVAAAAAAARRSGP